MKIATLVISILFAMSLSAQTTPSPTPSPQVSGWNVSVNGGYSAVSNAGTNNGFFFSTAIRVAQNWSARGDVFVLTDPAVTISLVKPEYRFQPNFLKKSSASVPQNLEFFVNAGIGDAHYTDPAKGSNTKFAYGFGGGFDVKVSDTVTVRPLDVNYLRSSLIGGGQVIGNHLQFGASLGLRF